MPVAERAAVFEMLREKQISNYKSIFDIQNIRYYLAHSSRA
jgi:hypothetical protein